MPLLLNKTRAAAELGVSRDVLLRLLNRGEIPVTMVDQEVVSQFEIWRLLGL